MRLPFTVAQAVLVLESIPDVGHVRDQRSVVVWAPNPFILALSERPVLKGLGVESNLNSATVTQSWATQGGLGTIADRAVSVLNSARCPDYDTRSRCMSQRCMEAPWIWSK